MHAEPVILHRLQASCRRASGAGRRSRACAASTARRCRRRARRRASPFAFSPSARLAATVDLPTPPLPEATAMIAPTPGMAPRWVRGTAACAAGRPARRAGGRARLRRHPAPRRGLRGQHRRHREHAGQRVDRLLGRLAQRLQPRAALGLDLDREGDIAVADRDPRDHAERHDVAAAVGVGDGREGVEDLLFGDGHVIPQSGGRNLGGADAFAGFAQRPMSTTPSIGPGTVPARAAGAFLGTAPRNSPCAGESGSAGSA